MTQTEAGRMQAGGGMRPSDEAPDKPFGPVAAVFLAAGIGALVLGILTTVAEASEDFKSALEWAKSVGSLSGKTLIASAVFGRVIHSCSLVCSSPAMTPRPIQ